MNLKERLWAGFNWFRIRDSDEILWTRPWAFGCHRLGKLSPRLGFSRTMADFTISVFRVPSKLQQRESGKHYIQLWVRLWEHNALRAILLQVRHLNVSQTSHLLLPYTPHGDDHVCLPACFNPKTAGWWHLLCVTPLEAISNSKYLIYYKMAITRTCELTATQRHVIWCPAMFESSLSKVLNVLFHE